MLLVFVVVGLALSTRPAVGQPVDAGLDVRLLYDVYGTESTLARGTLRAADLSAYPAFALAAPALAVVAWERGTSYEPAYRMLVAEGVAVVGASLLKRVYARDRPYTQHSDITTRANALDEWVLEHDPLSFPSGHAALSFAVATSLALSYPEAEVVAPVLVWAALVSLSRVWLGVHYPSDVLTGALLGVAAGSSVHLLREAITPAFVDRPAEAHRASLFQVTVAW